MYKAIDRAYLHDICIVKNYADKKYKISHHKILKNSLVEFPKNKAQRGLNTEKTACNIARAKQKVNELALCNDWEYFVTLTIDGNKHDRADLKAYIKSFTQWLRNYNAKHRTDIKYIFIPEMHADGQNWHIHGLLAGLPDNHLKKNKNGYRDWQAYSERYGYCSIDKIKDKYKIASYITKYITKGINKKRGVQELNKKLYYCSKGLKTAEIIKKGIIGSEIPITPDYENDFIKVYNLPADYEIEKITQMIE